MRHNHGSDTSALIITRKDDRYPFRATEVDSISILLWKITYLTIIVCNFHKRRWSSEITKFSLETGGRGVLFQCYICENFPLVGLWLKASQPSDDVSKGSSHDSRILESVLIFRFLVFVCLLDLIILVLSGLKWNILFPFDTTRVMFNILVLHPSIAIRGQLG